MVPFLVESLESMIQKFCCSMFILIDVLEKAQSTIKLLKLNVTDKNIHKRDFKFSFGIKHELRALKRDQKISDSLIYTFKMEAKKFLSTLCNHILEKIPILHGVLDHSAHVIWRKHLSQVKSILVVY